MQAYVCRHGGQWLLVNRKIKGMTAPGGAAVPAGQAVLLRDGTLFRASGGDGGFLIEVSCGR